ncbi:MAG TPA: hypothetical protein GX738_06685 [Firmicutes bacterium]|nr:hypothetical protein [Bacillota bacterium]
MKEFLSQNNVEYTYVEITESMRTLKAFLHYRDNHPAFAEIKAAGRVGLPCIVVNEGEKVLFGKPDLAELS